MKTLGGILMGIGILAILGAAGTSDYQTTVSMVEVVPFHRIMEQVGVGFIVIFVGFLIFRRGERKSRYIGPTIITTKIKGR